MSQIDGRYRGQISIRPGKEDQLPRQQLARLRKGGDAMELELRSDGRFRWQGTLEGSYKTMGNIVRFTPELFGGQTLQEMQERSEEQGRYFGLAFIFNPFDLRLQGDRLTTTDDDSPIFTEYRREP